MLVEPIDRLSLSVDVKNQDRDPINTLSQNDGQTSTVALKQLPYQVLRTALPRLQEEPCNGLMSDDYCSKACSPPSKAESHRTGYRSQAWSPAHISPQPTEESSTQDA